MAAISNLSATLMKAQGLPSMMATPATNPLRGSSGHSTDELHTTFTNFVGETFFGQMIKAMRSTVGKPAYFNGGRAEEVFRGQLDQALAEKMTEASADRFAEPLFRQQFPEFADDVQSGGSKANSSNLNQLNQLARR